MDMEELIASGLVGGNVTVKEKENEAGGITFIINSENKTEDNTCAQEG